MSKPPDWWLKQREPRFGCADVTIVAIAAITAFVILILLLGRADFSTILERVPFGNAATATPNTSPNRSGPTTADETATAMVNSAVTPIAIPSTRPPNTISATSPAAAANTTLVVFKASSIKTVCDIHRGDKPSVGTPTFQAKVGWRVDLDGREDSIDGFHWYEVVVDDITAGQFNQNKGWIVDSCLSS